MADEREPPPLSNFEGDDTNLFDDDDSDDLFKSAVEVILFCLILHVW